MFNPEALSCSERNLDAQIEFTLEALLFIRQITPVHNSINMLKDYFYECDAVGIGASNINYNIQYKVRPDHTDFVIVAKKLSGQAATDNDGIGFWYEGSKYAFRPMYDFLIERIKGVDYLVTREQILSMQLLWPHDLGRAVSRIDPKLITTDDGSSISNGEYYVYFPLDKLAKIQFALLQASNPSLQYRQP